MIKCSNNKCKKNPLDSLSVIFINVDGDSVCDTYCKKEYEKQKNEFFGNIHDDQYYNYWLKKDI